MKQVLQLTCYFVLFTLPGLGAGLHVGKESAVDEHKLPQHHAHLEASKDLQAPLRNLRHQPIIALQASQATHLQKSMKKVSSGKKSRALARKSKKSKKSWLWTKQLRAMKESMTQGLKHMFKGHQKQRLSLKQEVTQSLGICRKNKLRWWIKIKRKCVKAFGRNSKWNRDALDGKCAEAWSECNTGFYAVCCTQPQGAKNMEAYCANKNLTFVNASDVKSGKKKDKACQVQNKMSDVQKVMKGIKGAVAMLQEPDPPLQLVLSMPGPAPAPMPVTAAPAKAPPGLTEKAPAPAPAPVMATAPKKVDKCAMLKELTRQAAEKINAIKMWAEKDGIQKKHDKSTALKLYQDIDKDDADAVKKDLEEEEKSEDTEAKDPDMAFAVKGVLNAGEKLNALLQGPSLCKTADEEEEEDEETEEDEPAAAEEEDEEEDDEPDINETAIMGLLSWEGEMTTAVDKFEKDVHPHGFKWWRYRYEYTLVESLVLAASVLVLYFVMWLLHGVSFFQAHQFYKTGVTDRLLRYAWAYFVFHAASLMVMVTVAYMLYIPWGKQNIFNWFAEVTHDLVDGRANVPYLGYSWLYMVLDVQFQLFICFALYALFLLFVINNYRIALDDFKALGDNEDRKISPRNLALYNHLDSIIKKRVMNTQELVQIFSILKLRLPGVPKIEASLPGWVDFRLHLYLTDGLGKSVEYLCQVSLTTNLFLFACALIVAILAHQYQVAFMYFLPGFVVVGLIMFIAGYFVARHFRALADDDDHNTPAKYVTVHSFCRAVQIMLYCVFFSFSRLLLSNDIFEFYPKVYFSALAGLAIIIVLLAWAAGEVIKETSCALILPPHITDPEFQKKLDQVVFWHTTDKCHECGVQQFPDKTSLSRAWAGKNPMAKNNDTPPLETPRPYSWRG